MRSQPFAVVFKLRDGSFLTPDAACHLAGFRPSEVWIFGAPATAVDRELWRAVAAGVACLRPEDIHRIAGRELDPVFQQEYQCRPVADRKQKP